MTLVVSEISKLGIVMVGDSAVTATTDHGPRVDNDAVKIHYSTTANVGFSIWGTANISKQRMDYWMDNFIREQVNNSDTIDSIANRLASTINQELERSDKTWDKLIRGIHLAGYRNRLPCLYHIHCGHPGESPHELRVYRDDPDDQGWDTDTFEKFLEEGNGCQLRNGYIPLFAELYNSIRDYSTNLERKFSILFPQNTIESHTAYYKLLVSFVAGVLRVADRHPGVNDKLSAIAFNRKGLIVDQRLKLSEVNTTQDSSMKVYF